MLRISTVTMVLASLTSAFVAVGCGGDTPVDTGVGVSSILFIKRQHTVTGGNGAVSVNVANGNGQVLDYERYVPGGSLNILSPARPDGVVSNITQDFPGADFNGVDVSFDAKQAVFSMKKDGNDHYHLYTAQLVAQNGKFEIHQRTGGNQDDINPVYLPGGRIAFVTNQMYTPMGTRADEYEHGRVVTQLATISVDGGDADRRLASQNLSHTVAPWLRADGKIGYSRWEHLGAVNDVKLFAANPDGTQMVAVAGQHGKPATALFSVRELEPNVMIGIATSRSRTIHAGALVKIDSRNAADPVCMDPKADKTGRACVDEENAKFEILTPDVPTGSAPSPVGRYREPSSLPDGRLLVSWADGPVNDLSELSVSPPDFGIYIFDPVTKKNQLIYNDRTTWDLNALPVAVRKEPPVIGDVIGASSDTTLPVRIGSVDVTKTSLKERVKGAQFGEGTEFSEALKQATRVRIIEGFSSEAAKGVTMFGLTMDEGAAVLGEAQVNADGSWLAEIPPYIPVHLQPIDKFGLSMRNQRTWIQGMPGEDRRCIGCHESRTGIGANRQGQVPTLAEQKQAEKFLAPVADRTEYPWAVDTALYPGANPKNLVQKMLNEKCASCHSGGANDPFAGRSYRITRTDPTSGAQTAYNIPYLDLSDRPVQVVYDRRMATYPASYVSLFYPAASEMGGRGTTVTGEKPPLWAIPNNARESVLIKKLNVKASDGTFAFGSPAMHPEDKGVTLTDEERQMLIRSIDLGGQYYSRQNTGFEPFNQDPVGAVKY